MKAVRPVVALNGVPDLQMRLGSHSTSGKEMEGEGERTKLGLVLYQNSQ